MKKRYIKPGMEAFTIETASMLALSLPNKTRDDVEVGAPNLYDDEEEEWEEEDMPTKKNHLSRY